MNKMLSPNITNAFPASPSVRAAVSHFHVSHITNCLPSLYTLVPGVVIVWYIYRIFRPRKSDGSQSSRKMHRNIPWRDGDSLAFYKSYRCETESFLLEGFGKLGDIFAFKFFKHTVIAVRGKEARKVLYSHKSLHAMEGANLLRSGGLAYKRVKGSKIDLLDATSYNNRFRPFIRKERIKTYIPAMVEIIMRYSSAWGKKGRFNPWENHYQIMTHLLLLILELRELADSDEATEQFSKLLEEFDSSETFGALFLPGLTRILPKIPFARYIFGDVLGDSQTPDRRVTISKELRDILLPLLDKRFSVKERNEGNEGNDINEDLQYANDPLQQLIIKEDLSRLFIVRFILSTMNNGLLNNVRTICWLTAYVLSSAKYKTLVRNEVESVLNSSAAPATESLISRLSQVEMEVWESKMPVLDACILETIRCTLRMPIYRAHIGDQDIVLQEGSNGEKIVVKPGECVTMATSVLHSDERLYPDPTKWDPMRYEMGQHKKEDIAYLGWGAGRHTCTGRRLAELIIKLNTAVLFSEYPNCSLELGDGAPVESTEALPEFDENSPEVFGHPVKPIYVRCAK